MAKITRLAGNLKAFASNAVGLERTVFGDVVQDNTLSGNIVTNFLRGWGVISPTAIPTKQDFNALGFTSTQLSAYLHQAGVAEWDAAQEYYIGGVTNRNGSLYTALTDNTNKDPESFLGVDWRDTAHKSASDPHPQYLTPVEANALYKPINAIDVPTGTVLSGYFNAIPTGFLSVDGVLLSRATYANLWAHVQALEAAAAGILVSDATWLSTTNNVGLFSTGDGLTTFRIPDHRDMFARAKSAVRGLGSYEPDEFKSHSHSARLVQPTGVVGGGGSSGYGYNTQTGLTGGSETRPKNIALTAIIKY